ncbi:MAG TPA: periplasmic heavy metal sensor [Pyrinomonadaceae bacterium]|nr:periplasmic heavy metal sensor [Pyrinomonadaceae bacterium]
MDKARRSSWLVRAAALVIFLLGFAAGALAPAAYRAWQRDGRRDRFERMSEDLKLSPEQQGQVRQIFGETRNRLEALRKESEPRFAEIRREADERLKQVLTPEQWEQFRKSREEGRGRGRRGGGRGGDNDGPRGR